MLQFINPIKIIVLLTFLAGLFLLKKDKKDNSILFFIITICFLNELISSLLKYNNLSINSLFTCSVILHNSLWLILITTYLKNKQREFILFGYMILAVLNILFFEGLDKFNYYTFVLGALLYTSIFIFISFRELQEEQLSFFVSNNLKLLFAPVMFFLGLSFMFCFRSHQLTSTLIFGDVKLYTFINYTVNIVYYTLINIYILKERKCVNV